MFPLQVQIFEYKCIDASTGVILWVWSLKVHNLLELFAPDLKQLFMLDCHAMITAYKRNNNTSDMLASSKNEPNIRN